MYNIWYKTPWLWILKLWQKAKLKQLSNCWFLTWAVAAMVEVLFSLLAASSSSLSSSSLCCALVFASSWTFPCSSRNCAPSWGKEEIKAIQSRCREPSELRFFGVSRAFDLSRTLAVTVIVESLLSSGASSAISRKSTVDNLGKEENKETAPTPNKADSRKRQKLKGAAYKKNGEQNKLQSAETQGALRIGWMGWAVVKRHNADKRDWLILIWSPFICLKLAF